MSYDGYGDSNISVGPWGGRGGARWDDGVYTTVRQVVICHGAGIDSIQFEYDRRGSSVWSDKHGGTGGVKRDKVELDYPDEFLVSISGYYGSVVDYGSVLVRALTFQTNRKNYGPFGMQLGTYFSFPITGGKVVGFHGRSSWFLDSVGVYLKPLVQRNPANTLTAQSPNYLSGGATEKYKGHDYEVETIEKVEKRPVNIRQTVSYGPWGGNGGTVFDDGVYTGVREIHLTRYGGIFSLKVCYDMNGQAIWGTKHGGSGGIRLDKITFDYPSEILTKISGFYGSTIMRGPIVVKSLTFHTNKRKYGPFGEEQGSSFLSGTDTGVIVGFHGRKGLFVDSIGVHVLEGKNLQPPRSYNNLPNAPKVNEGLAGMVKEAAPVALRQWGGDGGTPWDDGVFSGVKRIFLTKGEAIYCIQIEYDRNDQSVWSVRHGGGSEGSSHVFVAIQQIKFDCPQEILTSVCGYYGALAGDERAAVIRSLTFFTNKGKYGPFGEERGTFFSSTKSEGKIVGFHGRSGCYLNAVGVHMRPWSSDQQEPVEVGAAVKMIINRFRP
ncbi:jacalin-related lectin 3-like isoform X3 [Tripterygium wilfordii]|uniref:jacalin-related lectin 3-like isoform X3 n=1 Tax=Tripterygium wilfordii TaxID=458696 RepID=UPI0018F7E7F5|nr:jacalin-related lectin 3-like isoform X3 [Tripterygium wilfordii]